MESKLPAETALPAPGSNWKTRFFSIFAGQVFSLLGSQLVQFALIWYLTQQTGSATTLAIASLVGMLPMVVLSPVQGVIAPEMQGRVFAFVGSLATGMAPIGLILAGPVADLVGIQAWFWLGGGVCALMGLAAFFIQPVFYLEDHHASQPAEAAS